MGRAGVPGEEAVPFFRLRGSFWDQRMALERPLKTAAGRPVLGVPGKRVVMSYRTARAPVAVALPVAVAQV